MTADDRRVARKFAKARARARVRDAAYLNEHGQPLHPLIRAVLDADDQARSRRSAT